MRQDIARYAYGAKRMRNFLPTMQGPVRKRPGAMFRGEVSKSAAKHWLVPFVFSQTDKVMLELGDSTLRFYGPTGQAVEASKPVTAATNASPGVFTITSHGWANGDELFCPGFAGMSGIAGRNFRVANATTHTFTLTDLYGVPIATTAVGTFTSGSFQRIYQIATPWPASALTAADGSLALSWVQSGDTLVMCLKGYKPQRLTRTAPTAWTLADAEFTGGPFKTVPPAQTVTVYASAATGTGIDVIASANSFVAGHVGGLILIEKALTEIVTSWEPGKAVTTGAVRRSQGHYYESLNSATTGAIVPSHTEGSRFDGDTGVNWQYLHSGYGWAKITQLVNATTVKADVISRIPSGAVGSGNTTTRWAVGAWSDAEGWPTHVAFFRERLVMGRGTQIWGSVPADFFDFSQRDAGLITADSAFDLDIRTGRNDSIQWMMPTTDLLVGTAGGEMSVGELSNSEPLGPSNVGALAGPGFGARQVQPVKINDSAFYVHIAGAKLRELRFAYETDGYVSLDRTAFADHIAKGRIVQLAAVQEDDSLVWAACANGELIAMSFEREHELLAWHKHPIGGNGVVESIAAMPSEDGLRDELWLIVRRTINGQTKRHVESLSRHWDGDAGDDPRTMTYSDSSLSYFGPALSTLNGLHHLEGQIVQIWADGARQADQAVVGGAITLTSAASFVSAGLGYEAVLESMPLGQPSRMKRLARAYVRVADTIGLHFAGGDGLETEVVFRDGGLSPDQPTPPSTAVHDLDSAGSAQRETTWTLSHKSPSACTILGLVAEIEQ